MWEWSQSGATLAAVPTRLLPAVVGACLSLGVAAAPARAQDPVIAAAGDIACDPTGASFNGGDGEPTRCRQKYTSDLLVGRDLAAVLVLGDAQYEEGTLEQFMGSYDLSWGRVKPITRPVIGNHEYRLEPGTGFWDYYNGVAVADGPAGERGKGYYSFDVGGWHLIGLNSMCVRVGGCAAGSPQEQWLRADLAANDDAACTLAYWHHPLYNSGPEGSYADTVWNTTDLWQALYEAGADVVLSGHAHAYERFGPQDARGNADAGHGLRQFIVGVGGASFGTNGEPQPSSELRDITHFGVLDLVLHPNGYDWKFLGEDGTSLDAGSSGCHGAPDLVAPSASITSGPPEVSTQRNASFSFTSSEIGSSFTCSLDGPASQPETPCASPKAYSELPDGTYTFSVWSTDAGGNRDATPATWSFTVDATSPETSITSGPDAAMSTRDAAIAFVSSETDSRFECRLDGGAWTPCASPSEHTGLPSGTHTFEARAIDPVGNIDPTPAARTWSIELSQDIRPSSYEVVAGSVFRNRGAIRRLYRNDRRRLKVVAARKREDKHLAVFDVAFAIGRQERTSLRGLTLAYDGAASARGAAVTVRVLNRRARRWIKAFGPRTGRRDRSLAWSASVFATDYVSRRGVMRVRVVGKGADPFRTRTDVLGVTVQY